MAVERGQTFTGGPLDGQWLLQSAPGWVTQLNVPIDRTGYYVRALDGLSYSWRLFGQRDPRPEFQPIPRSKPRVKRSPAQRSRKKLAADRRREAQQRLEYANIDAEVTAHEARIRARPKRDVPPLMWDGSDTKATATCHATLPSIHVVEWILDQDERDWELHGFPAPTRRRHAATA